jgi:hypothetical protein
MALCTCASMVLGLMTTPQSTAQVTRLTATLPSMETRRQDLASTPETCRKPRALLMQLATVSPSDRA